MNNFTKGGMVVMGLCFLGISYFFVVGGLA